MEIVQQFTLRHTGSLEKRSIEYIVIHYTSFETSRPGMALETAKFFRESEREASADFIVDDETVVQYNGDMENRYSWHCGDARVPGSKGGRLNGICTNRNSIGIELCSSAADGKQHEPNDPDMFYTPAVLHNAAELIVYLMKKYGIPVENVVRHYDVSGKLCPGIVGWNAESGDESRWIAFRNKLTETERSG